MGAEMATIPWLNRGVCGGGGGVGEGGGGACLAETAVRGCGCSGGRDWVGRVGWEVGGGEGGGRPLGAEAGAHAARSVSFFYSPTRGALVPGWWVGQRPARRGAAALPMRSSIPLFRLPPSRPFTPTAIGTLLYTKNQNPKWWRGDSPSDAPLTDAS